MFRRAASLLDFSPRDGQQVEVRGRIGIYEPRGELQCVAEAMLPLGAGSLYELFLRQKAKLEAAGLFDADTQAARGRAPARDRHRQLHRRRGLARCADHAGAARAARAGDRLPERGAGLRRRPRNWCRRCSAPAGAPRSDTLIVCRGGGSIEDLWAFNDEAVVRAIAACPLPVVCGVGHETDVTLADLAADLRAPTPTAAAELAAPLRDELLQTLEQWARRLTRAQRQRVDRDAQGLDLLSSRFAHAVTTLRPQRQRLDLLAHRAPRRADATAAICASNRSRTQRNVGSARQLRAASSGARRDWRAWPTAWPCSIRSRCYRAAMR